ncbi:MAG TPA: hypothetical protein EYN67_17285 [Flavobacteriales bacterium]|nr:hypothetical protein [Flavobacteriales bacterium]HIO15374.1 hypothetical protein [Flavobacteriales bacterium]
MAIDKHIPLEDLVSQLEKGVKEMVVGNLSKEGMELLHQQSRELHERLTILRYKAFEAMVQSADNEVGFLIEDLSQTNLIDSIAEVIAEVDPVVKKRRRSKTLAESLQSLPLSSIGEGLTILDRANFTSTLFSNDDMKFNDMLDSIDACSDFDQAVSKFTSCLATSGTKPEIDSALKSFEKRISRRFAS